MMLKYEVNSLDSVAPELKDAYEEKNGVFILKVDGVPTIDTTELEKELELYKKKHGEAEKHRKEQERRAEEAQLEAARKGGDLEALEKSLKQQAEQNEAALNDQLKNKDRIIERLTLGNTARDIAGRLFVQEAAADPDFVSIIQRRLRLDVEGENTKIRVVDQSGNLTGLTIEDLEKEMRSRGSLAHVLVASRANGSGGPGPKGAPSVKVRDLSPQEKHEFIKEHGQKKYLELSAKEMKKRG